MPIAAASFSEPGPPYFRTQQIAEMKISSSSSAIVSSRVPVHQTPHALRPQSGPLTRPNRPKSTASSAAATAMRSAPRLFLEQIDQRSRRRRRRSAVNIAIHDGEVEVEDLLHQQHRRLVRRVARSRTARTRTSAAVSATSGMNSFSHDQALPSCHFDLRVTLGCSLRHQRLERPQRQRDEHDVEDTSSADPHASPSARPAATRAAPPCRARPQ